ncbi:MAG: LptF/LptG family permease, partial [Candidatus Marisimplicoccus sp.]
KSMASSHPLRRLPNLNNNQTDSKKPIFDYMESKEKYNIINVLQNSESEVDILLRQINNKKKNYFLQQKLINLHTLTINEKYTLVFACIFLFLIGASIGAIIRKGGIGLPLVLSICIFLTYHYIGVFGKNAAEDSTIDPYVGSWISTVVIAPFAIYLTRIVSQDGRLNFIYIDRLLNLFRRLFIKKK